MPDPRARKTWGIAEGQVYDPRWATRWIRQELKRQGVPFCDVTSAFQAAAEPETLFLETVPRLSRRGHQMFAQAVLKCLQRILLPPRPLSESFRDPGEGLE